MDVLLRVTAADDAAEMTALWSWLQDERILRPGIRRIEGSLSETELGGVVDVLAVTLGSGGAGVALARSLVTWLQTRRPHVSLSVMCGNRTVKLDAQGMSEEHAMAILEDTLRASLSDSNDD